MDYNDAAQQMVAMLSEQFMSLIIPAALAFLFAYAIKDFMSNVFEYTRLMINKNIAKGVLVDVDGIQGMITSIKFDFICVEEWTGEFHKIPVTGWRKHTWKYPKIDIQAFFVDYNRKKKELLESVANDRRKH